MKWQNLPPLLLYPVLIPHIAKLCLKYKTSPAIISKANPAIPYSGLPFASKTDIQTHFPQTLPAIKLSQSEDIETRKTKAKAFSAKHNYPLILKPDQGHRSIAIQKITTELSLLKALEAQTWDLMLQKYSALPKEFSIFYIRPQKDQPGIIHSITEKIIPSVTADGSQTLESLIKNSLYDKKNKLKTENKSKLSTVYPKEKEIPLLISAGHCRGAIFKDREDLLTEALKDTIQSQTKNLNFRFGRFDVKAQDEDSLKAGQFDIIEINGATSEFIHIYDQKYTWKQGISLLKDQWSILFKIANDNRASEGLTLKQFLEEYRCFFQKTKHATGSYW